MILLSGVDKLILIKRAITEEKNARNKYSRLNKSLIFLLVAPRLRRIPISLIRSIIRVFVKMLVIIDDTKIAITENIIRIRGVCYE